MMRLLGNAAIAQNLAQIALAGHFTPAVAMTGEVIHLMEPPDDHPVPPRKGEHRPQWIPRALCGRDAIETVSAASWWMLTPAHRCKACIRVGIVRLTKEKEADR